MKLQKSTTPHDPKNGLYGDCYRACIATITGMQTEDVPHFTDGPDDESSPWIEDVRAWLRNKDLSLFKVNFDTSLEEVLNYMKFENKNIYYILSGSSDGENHAVVAKGNEQFGEIKLDGPVINPDFDSLFWVSILIPSNQESNIELEL